MKCPYCCEEMEKGIIYVDGHTTYSVVYKSEEDAQKKGFLAGLKTNPIVWCKYLSSREEAYRCKSCKKVIAVLNEE